MAEVEIIHELTSLGGFFILQHPFDLSSLDCANLETVYLDRASAERAAALVMLAVTATDD
ncbi:hypothetical protein [Herbiconiux daphne]|uniref:Uncharacterized protein n=1 Tax=Herbiconiux daphne TaxID=2970914 RepID=A0ABT2GX68_9MICO|nr:hypothetical protein [Herbiconiux daphne]MCS5732481.1 hypothetical protein [Herbiconiux daphne]